MTTPENSVLFFENCEIRASKNAAGKPIVSGLAVPYEKRSQLIYGLFYEIIRDGAFRSHLAENPDVKFFLNHNSNNIISRTKAKTLTLTETTRGIEFVSEVPDTNVGLDFVKNVDNGNLDAMSFGFRALTYDWGMVDGEELRDVQKAALYEISAVTDPAYLDTQLMKRSAEQLYEELKRNKQDRHDKEMADLDNRRKRLEILEKC